MTGPEHYRDAERAFENAKDYEAGSDKERFFLDAAQYHATMAHAAATALQAALPLVGDDQQVTEWGKAIGANLTTDPVARIESALLLIDEMATDGRIVDGADKLRAALGVKDGDQ